MDVPISTQAADWPLGSQHLSRAEMLHGLRHAAAQLAQRTRTLDGMVATGTPGVELVRSTTPQLPKHRFYPAAVCIVIQGQKQVRLTQFELTCAAGEGIVVSLDLPVHAKVIEASAERPYLALVLELDLALLKELSVAMHLPPAEAPTLGLASCTVSDSVLAAALRLMEVSQDPTAAQVLGPGHVRELYFHLLRSTARQHLHFLLSRNGPMKRVADAVAYIRAHLTEPLRIDALAQLARMSPSSFRAQFKVGTDYSPLQYIKRLRLLRAQELLLSDLGQTVKEVAYAMGYASASQFSREYKSLFGVPPSHRPHSE